METCPPVKRLIRIATSLVGNQWSRRYFQMALGGSPSAFATSDDRRPTLVIQSENLFAIDSHYLGRKVRVEGENAKNDLAR
jgi:hypothetical protein